MMRGAIEQVKSAHTYLSELDAACGDGDHGTTMLRATKLVEQALAGDKPQAFKDLIYNLGWTLLGIDGGATGPLLGTLFLGMSEAVGDRQELDGPGLAAIFESGLRSLEKHTKARVGDKTMMDALAPAIAALQGAAGEGKGIEEMLSEAAQAAQQGALSTRGLMARFGKAKFSQERSLGHQDAGATSMALVFRGFYEGLARLEPSDSRRC